MNRLKYRPKLPNGNVKSLKKQSGMIELLISMVMLAFVLSSSILIEMQVARQGHNARIDQAAAQSIHNIFAELSASRATRIALNKFPTSVNLNANVGAGNCAAPNQCSLNRRRPVNFVLNQVITDVISQMNTNIIDEGASSISRENNTSSLFTVTLAYQKRAVPKADGTVVSEPQKTITVMQRI